MTIGQVFSIDYGSREYHSKSWLRDKLGDMPLIASGGRDNGVYGKFGIAATHRHVITVASTGSAGSTFYHGYDCAISDDALVLSPLKTMSPEEMLWYVYMIRLNQHRFSYGRKVTPERLSTLDVPEPRKLGLKRPSIKRVSSIVASELNDIKLEESTKSLRRTAAGESTPVTIESLFTIEYGNSYELCNLTLDAHGVNFVSRTTRNNGVSAKVAKTDTDPYPQGCLTVALGSQGGALETSCQTEPFYPGRDIAVLTAIKPMTLEEKLYYCMAVKLHKFRFNFGRQANRTLPRLLVRPAPSWIGGMSAVRVKEGIAVEIRGLFDAEPKK